jgi:hypothetical protein
VGTGGGGGEAGAGAAAGGGRPFAALPETARARDGFARFFNGTLLSAAPPPRRSGWAGDSASAIGATAAAHSGGVRATTMGPPPVSMVSWLSLRHDQQRMRNERSSPRTGICTSLAVLQPAQAVTRKARSGWSGGPFKAGACAAPRDGRYPPLGIVVAPVC